MPTSCSSVNADILADCFNKPVGNVESEITVITKDDWNNATLTYDTTNPLILTGITLKTGAKAFKFQVFAKGFKPKFETQDTDFGPYYKHSVGFTLPAWTNSIKAQVPALTAGYSVLIVENKKKGETAFEVYGASQGLRAPDLARDLAANEGSVTGTFTNDADANEDNPPLTFLKTGGYAATKTAVQALYTAAA